MTPEQQAEDEARSTDELWDSYATERSEAEWHRSGGCTFLHDCEAAAHECIARAEAVRATIERRGEAASRENLRAAVSHVEVWMARALAAEAKVAASRARIEALEALMREWVADVTDQNFCSLCDVDLDEDGHAAWCFAGRAAALSPAAPEPVSAPKETRDA